MSENVPRTTEGVFFSEFVDLNLHNECVKAAAELIDNAQLQIEENFDDSPKTKLQLANSIALLGILKALGATADATNALGNEHGCWPDDIESDWRVK